MVLPGVHDLEMKMMLMAGADHGESLMIPGREPRTMEIRLSPLVGPSAQTMIFGRFVAFSYQPWNVVEIKRKEEWKGFRYFRFLTTSTVATIPITAMIPMMPTYNRVLSGGTATVITVLSTLLPIAFTATTLYE